VLWPPTLAWQTYSIYITYFLSFVESRPPSQVTKWHWAELCPLFGSDEIRTDRAYVQNLGLPNHKCATQNCPFSHGFTMTYDREFLRNEMCYGQQKKKLNYESPLHSPKLDELWPTKGCDYVTFLTHPLHFRLCFMCFIASVFIPRSLNQFNQTFGGELDLKRTSKICEFLPNTILHILQRFYNDIATYYALLFSELNSYWQDERFFNFDKLWPTNGKNKTNYMHGTWHARPGQPSDCNWPALL